MPEMGEILEVLVLEYDCAGTRTRTHTREVSIRTRTRKSPYSPTSVICNLFEICDCNIRSYTNTIVKKNVYEFMLIVKCLSDLL